MRLNGISKRDRDYDDCLQDVAVAYLIYAEGEANTLDAATRQANMRAQVYKDCRNWLRRRQYRAGKRREIEFSSICEEPNSRETASLMRSLYAPHANEVERTILAIELHTALNAAATRLSPGQKECWLRFDVRQASIAEHHSGNLRAISAAYKQLHCARRNLRRILNALGIDQKIATEYLSDLSRR
jgi:DNA-directed RNA polymerase specialized sigma24 family protein